MEQYDIIIIGAGPVGLYLASLLKQFSVLILEENKSLGKKACSGFVSTNIENLAPVKPEIVEHKIKGIIIHSPKTSVKIEKEKFLGFVINRGKFENNLLKGIGKNKVLFNKKATQISIEKGKVTVKTKNKSFSAKLLVGCDGANSIVAKTISQKPKEIVLGLTAVVQKPNNSDFAEVYLDKGIVSDGFLWKIPRGSATEYGMLGKNARFEILEKFFNIKNYERNAAPIPIGVQKTYSDRALLVGDSARQVKPWTGGGIVYGLTAARMASDVITEAMIRNDFSEELLRQYETEWKKVLGKNIRYGLFLRNIYKRMNNYEIEIAIKILKLFRKKINKKDYDFPF